MYNLVLAFESVDEIPKGDHSNESYWVVLLLVLFIMLYKVAPTCESVGEILKCDHSNESLWAVLSCGVVYCAVQPDSSFWVCGWNHKVWQSSTFLWCSVNYAIQAGFSIVWKKSQCVTIQMKAVEQYARDVFSRLRLIQRITPLSWVKMSHLLGPVITRLEISDVIA